MDVVFCAGSLVDIVQRKSNLDEFSLVLSGYFVSHSSLLVGLVGPVCLLHESARARSHNLCWCSSPSRLRTCQELSEIVVHARHSEIRLALKWPPQIADLV